jgi:2-aminoethylphosphonate dioxygenase
MFHLCCRSIIAKRYLCCKNPEYHDQLSDASKTTLRFQGGPMTPEQAAAFELDPDFDAIVLMRKVDELAKDPDAEVPPLEAWFPLIDKFSTGYTGGNSYVLSCQQIKHYKECGFLVVPNLLQFEGISTNDISGWVTEISSWEKAEKKWLLHWEKMDGAPGGKQLCRVENFVDYHEQMGSLCRGALKNLCSQAFGEEAALFKEKINFKLPGGAGFAAHQDSPAYTCVGLGEDHISVMVAVDDATLANGCLEVAAGVFVKDQVPLTADGVVEPETEKTMEFKPVVCPAGTVMLFSGYVPHRSNSNTSDASRRAMYITYNPVSQGDLHEKYYIAKHTGSQGFSSAKTISFQNDFKGTIVD